MADQLTAFLRSKKERSATQEVDWRGKKETWVRSIQHLYDRVEELLADSIAAKDVAVRKFDADITEEFLGTYSVPVLDLIVGNERVEFRPKGITVIGASGRVDILGDGDTVTLLRDREDAETGWSVVRRRVPKLEIAPLDRDSLQYALERVMLPLQ
jgi:hypothetical protein